MALVLSFVDAANGSGGTATIAGTGGGAYVVYSALTGGAAAFAQIASGTGDGSFACPVPVGTSWLYATSGGVASVPILVRVTASPLSVYGRCLLGCQAIVQGLNLANLPSTQVYNRWTSEEDLTVAFPNVTLSIVGNREEESPFSTEQDGAVYGVDIKVRARIAAPEFAQIDAVLIWRQEVMWAVRRQPTLPGVPELWRTTIKPDPVAEFDPKRSMLYEGGLKVLCWCVEPPSS